MCHFHQISRVRYHPHLNAHAHNSLNFHTVTMELHNFVNLRSSQVLSKNGAFLSLNYKQVKKQQSCTVPCHISFGWTHLYRQRETSCAICCGCGVTYTFLRGITFPYTPYVMGVTTSTLFWNSFERSIGVGKPKIYRQVHWNVYRSLYENNGCMKTHKVLW